MKILLFRKLIAELKNKMWVFFFAFQFCRQNNAEKFFIFYRKTLQAFWCHGSINNKSPPGVLKLFARKLGGGGVRFFKISINRVNCPPPYFAKGEKNFGVFSSKRPFFFYRKKGRRLNCPPPYFFKILVGRGGGAVDSIYTDTTI